MSPEVDELWLPIPGYEGKYEVSSLGRVRSRARDGEPYIRRLRAGTRGYLNVTLFQDGRHECHAVHALVLLAFHGPRSEGMVTRHLDGNTSNNVVANLTYGTQAENIADQMSHGTHSRAFRTECRRGHPYTPENTYMRPGSGARQCRTCSQEYERRRPPRKRRRNRQAATA